MANVLTTIQELIQQSLAPGDPDRPLPIALQDAAARLQSLFSLQLEPTGDGLERWLATLRSLLTDVEVRETLLLRVLQVKLPRVAEALTLVGAVKATWQVTPDGAGGQKHTPITFTLDWDALEGFTRTPGKQALATLLARVRGVRDVQALQVLLLLLATGPEDLVGLEYRHQGFLALPEGQGLSLQDLVDLVNSPVAVPLGNELATRAADRAWIAAKRATALAGDHLVLDRPDALPFDPAAPLNGVSLTLRADAARLRAAKINLWGTGWILGADASADGAVSATVAFAGTTIDTSAGARGNARVRVSLAKPRPEGSDAFLLGDRSGTHVAIRDLSAGLSFNATPSEPVFGVSFVLDGVRFALGLDLLKPIAMGLTLPGALTFDSLIDLAFLQGLGLQLASGDGLTLGTETRKHLGYSIGGSGAGLWVDDVLARVEVSVGGRRLAFRVLLRFDARAELGPLKATLSGAGVWLGRWTSGNAGVLEPTGIGLSLDAGPITGGGFFGRLGPGEYGGALTLKILGIGAFAYGIHQELPGGGVSFVAVIGVRLPAPGVQVGFGFAITGFGGLIGINRRADTDKLRARLTSGTAGEVLFTDDPTRNAPRILGELRELFPDERGVHVAGPTIKLTWINLIFLDVGLFIELPGPRKIFVAGTGRLVVGSEDLPLVNFRLDFIGGVDLTTSLVYFDGALVNSTLLGIIKVTGGIALRVDYGANPSFLFTVGGFHPAFDPGGMAVPQVARAGASLEFGPVWLRQETYFAVTSNTVQFGAHTEAGIDIGPISVHGWFGFDTLVQFKPFRFVATIDAGMSACFAGYEFASIRVRGELSGPGPLRLHATASVKVLVRVSKSLTLTLDDSPAERVPTIPNLAHHLRDELTNPANLRVEATDAGVVLRSVPGGADALDAAGTLVWEQKRVPLARRLEKAEARPLDPPRTLTVAVTEGGVPLATTAEEDLFALGTFAKLSDGEALAGPGFSPGTSGFRLRATDGMAQGDKESSDRPTHVVMIPSRRRFDTPDGPRFGLGLLACLAEGRRQDHVPGVHVGAEAWRTPGSDALHAADAFLLARREGTFAHPASTPTVSMAGVL